jgi:hypothetical protein
MSADRHHKLIVWMKTRKVTTMKALRHQFQISHMTVFRILSQYGYHTSYNRNASYYALHDVPQFDQAGLWAYREIRFSRHGSLSDTIVALVGNAEAGLTVRELEERLQTRTANLLSRLVRGGRLTQRSLQGRLVVYLASDPSQADQQFQQRQQLLRQTPAPQQNLPEGCSAIEVIEILRGLVLSPKASPEELAQQLTARGLRITPGQVSQVTTHYALKKKRRR